MVSEILKVFSESRTRILLVPFATLSGLLLTYDPELLLRPLPSKFEWKVLLLVPATLASVVGLRIVFSLVYEFVGSLTERFHLRAGAVTGSALLSGCLAVTLNFLAASGDQLQFSLLAKPGFVHLCFLYLLAFALIEPPPSSPPEPLAELADRVARLERRLIEPPSSPPK